MYTSVSASILVLIQGYSLVPIYKKVLLANKPGQKKVHTSVDLSPIRNTK
jgi:hypothetical protein